MTTVTKGKIFRDDLDLYDGVTTTSSRPDSTGGTVTSNKINSIVDILTVYGNGTDRNRTTLVNSINAIGTNNATIELAPGQWTIDDDVTIPSNITVNVPSGALINVATGKNLTINGVLNTGIYQIANGVGAITPVLEFQWKRFPGTPTQTSATTFTLEGDQTSLFYPNSESGVRVKLVMGGTTLYGAIDNAVYATFTTLTVVLDSGSLTAALSEVHTGTSSIVGKEISSASVSCLPTWANAVNADARTLFMERPTTTLFGCIQDGVTVNTTALQNMIDSGVRTIYQPGGDLVTGPITLPEATISFIGESDPRSANRSRILYDPAGDANSAVFTLSVSSAGNRNLFQKIDVDTNDRAKYGFYLASGNIFHAIKNMTFETVFVMNLKSGAVGWQIGDETNTGLDTDAWNYKFSNCHTRGSAGSIGWVVDAQNAYNIAWENCSNGRKDGSNLMLTGIKTIRGSGFRIFNYFGDKLQSTGSPWIIDHNSGSMSINGMNTEDYRCIKARPIGRDEDRLIGLDIQINDATGDNEIVIDTTIITSLRDCSLKTTGGGDNRIIKSTNQIFTENVDLGSAGEYELTGEPRRNVVEGIRVGTLETLVPNSIYNFWVTTGADQPPINWGLNKGTGAGTIQQSTSNNSQGLYSVDINCTTANTGDVFGILMSREIPISGYSGTAMNLVAIATRTATESMEVECLVDSVNVMTGGSTVFEQESSGGKIMAWGRVNVPADSDKINATSIKVGLPSGSTGRIYVDCVALIPVDFTQYIPALFHHVQNLQHNELRDGHMVNNMHMFGYTVWFDNTGAMRRVLGNRSTDTDGTVIGP